MKLPFVFLLLLDIPLVKGQQKIEEFEHILLRFVFPSFYNSHNKSCCKLYPGGCYKLLDSTGYTCELLKGRVTKTENDGWIEFKISNVRFVDGGYYRCFVLGTQNHIYSDYYVEVSEASVDHSQYEPLETTTSKTLNTHTHTPTTVPDSTGPVLIQDQSNPARFQWSFSLPLVVIVSVTVMISIMLVIGVVCFRVRTKCKQSDKCGETLCESQKQEAPEASGIVYTTVDFSAHQKHSEVYANLMMPKTPAGTSETKQAEMVEYSTLAIH